ncbi:DUF4250 domain-containing protein [Gynuella sunshinyii]|uniref:DUF4250 domain-containing protein n=1 Tax=Gynuella sunshinyii YC6258 TaxID=1445510 RepID=A0A0C5VDL6_9GAMM|nr:DUF4250 domain-containing protein [Gynuella sunshinyii]AJQ92627.1 hypothetical Protein YC6258_00577 [Gynuella sunshinyii YC6258]
MFSDSSLRKMDPAMSLSLINMKLRDQFSSLAEFMNYYDLSAGFMDELLQINGWHYDADNNQLKEDS